VKKLTLPRLADSSGTSLTWRQKKGRSMRVSSILREVRLSVAPTEPASGFGDVPPFALFATTLATSSYYFVSRKLPATRASTPEQ
jgi:hypothetical protein